MRLLAFPAEGRVRKHLVASGALCLSLIHILNGEKEANGAIEKVQDMLYTELMSGQIRPALYTAIVKAFEGVK